MESSVLHCVNPYDVNPMIGAPSTPESFKEPPGAPLGRQIKLEMEEFSDLAPFLPGSAPKVMSNSIDELNTPIFDRKGPFDFTIYENTYNNTQPPAAEDPFKFEYDTLTTGNSVLSNKHLNDISVYSTNNLNFQVQPGVNNSEVVNNTVLPTPGSEASLTISPSGSDQADMYIINGSEAPMHAQVGDQISASLFKVEDNNSVISVNSNENQYSNVSSPSNEYFVNSNSITVINDEVQYINDEYYNNNNLGVVTPEDSNSCTGSDVSVKKVPKLKITLGGFFTQSLIPNTPDVIDSVVDLESTFNILDYVNEKDGITTVNVEDIHFDDAISSPRGIDFTKFEFDDSSRTRKRKPKRYEDDDEDYIPPSKKQASRRNVLVEDSDSDSDAEVSVQGAKRGRPPRRTSSISSDHSDASKYRELRDKNNEASRKSRLKRKMKEMTLEKEADVLIEKNIKLKAQVEELEKMVNNFRNNLFKIMMKK